MSVVINARTALSLGERVSRSGAFTRRSGTSEGTLAEINVTLLCYK